MELVARASTVQVVEAAQRAQDTTRPEVRLIALIRSGEPVVVAARGDVEERRVSVAKGVVALSLS